MRNHKHQVPAFESCESRLLMSSTALLSELLSTAHNVDVQPIGSVSVSGDLQNQGSDVYQFTAPASGRMVINMAATDGQIDTSLRILNSKGHLVRRNDNASKTTTDSQVVIKVKPGQTYYVVASAKGTNGSYSLNWTNNPYDDAGNTSATARALTLTRAGTARTTGTINYQGDVDMFRVVATQTGKMVVDLSANGRFTALDSELKIYDASGNLLTGNDDASATTLNSHVTFDVVAGTTYYVAAASHDRSTGTYNLTVTTQIAPPVPPTPPAPPAPPTGDLLPAATITATIQQIDGGLQLLVLGTSGADTITLSQDASGITMITSAGSQNFAGAFTSLYVYGFGGDDIIRMTNTVTATVMVDAGDGNDQVFNAGSSTATLLGGAGDDLLVSVGGGAATLWGGEGNDSFWFDSRDTAVDASTTETAGGAVHKINQFYQPYTTDTTSAQYVPLTIAGQNFTDPTTISPAIGYRNFSSQPLFNNGPQYNDIAQGQVGDCYFLATLASLADTDPQIIRQSIAPMGDGTYAVRFYDGSQSVYLRIDGDLPVTGGTSLAFAKTSSTGETWGPLLEKAFAYYRRGQNSYQSISAGWMNEVLSDMTGKGSTSQSTSATSTIDLFNLIQSNLAAGHSVTAGSKYNSAGPIVASHAYEIKSAQMTDKGATITVYNPWGFDGRSYDSNYSDGLLTLTMAQVQASFSTIMFSLA